MKLSSVHVIGGGPAGLFAATLLRRRSPGTSVTVHERTVPDDTFGFGVAFTRRTLEIIAGADDSIVEQLRRVSIDMPCQEMRIGAQSVFSDGNVGGITIARSALLKALLEQARGAGVEVLMGSEAHVADLSTADLVIAADGASSTTRTTLANELGPRVTPGRGVFMWLGCDTRLQSNLFAPIRTADGLFNIHCYPYSEGLSTIGVETDLGTWRRAGMDRWTEDTPAGETDKESISYLQNVFGDVLGGATLLGNRSRWTRFRTITADRWSSGNVVLIGDSAHTAHYSVGSGTKMAMEDSVSLVAALVDERHDSLSVALSAYEAERRPRVERLQDLADRSRWWWETLEERLTLPPTVLMLAYLSRGGAVTAAQVAEVDAALMNTALQDAGLPGRATEPAEIARAVLASPVVLNGQRLNSRILTDSTSLDVRDMHVDVHDPWGPAADSAAWSAATARRTGADVVVLTGPESRACVLDRLALAEHIRLRADIAVAVAASPSHIELLADGVIARRVDLVRFTSAEDPS